jgi:hypothetical protein
MDTNIKTDVFVKSLSEALVVPPWNETAGKVKASVYPTDKKGGQHGIPTEIYRRVQSASRP